MFKQFKEFAFKGSMVDLAVGLIIGTAFAKTIDSLIKHIIMPLINLVLPGEKGYMAWKLKFGAREIPFGLFIGETISFLLITFILFLFVVKFMGWLKKHREAEEEKKAEDLNQQEKLLTEIRDIIATQGGPAR